MSYVRLARIVLTTVISALLLKLVVHYGPVDKYDFFNHTSRDALSSYTKVQEQYLLDLPLENRRTTKDGNSKRRMPDKYGKLLYGINVSDIQERSYTKVIEK
jgi:hypothetical protein